MKKNIKSGACCEDAGTVTSVSQIISLCIVDEGEELCFLSVLVGIGGFYEFYTYG